MTKYELLAPAGQPDAGYAALHYGADAVYCGLAAFSARAEAINFTPDELALFARHAHSLTRRRRVYLTLNTLLQEDEVGRAVDTLATALDCGVDAVIVQDLGLAKIVAEHFPGIEMHASTQMAIHSVDGARAAKELGFHRVTLARELTLGEIAEICLRGGIEIETFIHGTLCYSYSGLCLFSSMTTGRSGNRGRCVYSCREAAGISTGPAGRAHPFSLKDMALGADVLRLAEAGVKSFKIEGRKKSPLYVGATVDYYRRLLDGRFAPGEEAEARARLRTIFARPWTKLFFESAHAHDVADTEVVGHRGALLGEVLGVVKTPAGPGVRFRAGRAVERHDGVQVDIPGEARPFGFGVDDLFLITKKGMESVFAAPAGAEIVVALPDDAPVLGAGWPVYQSSSQEVKRSFPFARPRSEVPEPDIPMWVRVSVEDRGGSECSVMVDAAAPGTGVVHVAVLPAFPARDADGAAAAARKAFERTGGSRFFLEGWTFVNPGGFFVKPGDWNALRRDVLDRMEAVRVERLSAAREAVHAALRSEGSTGAAATASLPVQWSLAVAGAEQLDGFTDDDRDGLSEVIVPAFSSPEALERLAARCGREKIRLALPFIMRGETEGGFPGGGWRKWLAPGLGQLAWLREKTGGGGGLDLAADWSLYVLNRAAAGQLRALGFSAFTFSPEDDAENISRLLAASSIPGWLTVYGDVPLFISAACAHANLGLCRGRAPQSLPIAMEKSGKVEIFPECAGGGNCGSVVVSEEPFSLPGRAGELRAAGARLFRVDCRWRFRAAGEVLSLWRAVRGGDAPGGSGGNFRRGLS